MNWKTQEGKLDIFRSIVWSSLEIALPQYPSLTARGAIAASDENGVSCV